MGIWGHNLSQTMPLPVPSSTSTPSFTWKSDMETTEKAAPQDNQANFISFFSWLAGPYSMPQHASFRHQYLCSMCCKIHRGSCTHAKSKTLLATSSSTMAACAGLAMLLASARPAKIPRHVRRSAKGASISDRLPVFSSEATQHLDIYSQNAQLYR